LAEAERERARAQLALTLFQTQATIGRVARQRNVAMEKLQRDRRLVESANRIAAMSLVAYREGAQALATVLEAQRNARDILSQYINDLADAWIATATLRLYALTAPAK
jgi:outer membrane protein TolC